MQIGIQLPEVERYVPWSEYKEMAVTADEAGFSSIWLGDHLLYDRPEGPTGPWECWTLLSAIAGVTKRALTRPAREPDGVSQPRPLGEDGVDRRRDLRWTARARAGVGME